MHHALKLYLLGMVFLLAADGSPLPWWVVLVSPILPVVIGYLLTWRKLKAQDSKVQEIHVLVNSQLSETLKALKDALLDNIALKARLGIPITNLEVEKAQEVKMRADKPNTVLPAP